MHCSLSIGSNLDKHGKSYWKLNNSILSDEYFRNKIENLLTDSRTLRPAFTSTGEWWDDVKTRIKKVAIKHSSIKKRETNELKNDLKSQLESATSPAEVHRLKGLLCDITNKELGSLAIRARVDKALYDEKCTAFFFNKIKSRHSKNFIHKIQDDDQSLKTGIDEILTVFHKFYETLYSEFPGDISVQNEILESLKCQHSVESEHSDNTSLFRSDSIKQCLAEMANNKTPGPDGLTAEFYKTFFDIISDILVEVYEEVSKGIIPRSMTEAVTVLIPKEGDPTLPSNYRPITLLNVDYKLMTKTINKSFFSTFLKNNISSQQLCAVPGRDIRNGTILIRDIISYCKSKGIPASIVSLDQKKAFDMVNRNFLYKVLKALKIDSRVLNFVETIYCNTHTSIQVNGHLSQKIALQRGVRQGCPLSPTLYVFYVHAFVSHISMSPRFSGVTIPGGHQCKVSAYADDLVMFCKDKDDEEYIFSFFEKVSIATGSSLNKSKTNKLHIGPNPFSTVYRREDVKICGVRFDFENEGSLSFRDCQVKIEKRIEKYKHLPLTLHGKVLVCNTLLFPLLFYVSATYLPSKTFCDKLKKKIFSFIWGEGKAESISRKVIQTPREVGGLGLSDITIKTRAIYFQTNFMAPCAKDFNHQRLKLFQYFFSFWCRNVKPDLYHLNSPHSFQLIKSYSFVSEILKQLEDHHDVIGNFAVSLQQMYRWLLGKIEEVEVRHPAAFSESKDYKSHCARLYRLYTDIEIDIRKVSFMWRVAVGALKTGEVVKKYKIPGARCSCVFCGEKELETVEHLFFLCPALKTIRAIAIQYYQDFELIVPVRDKDAMRILFILGLTVSHESKLRARNIFRVSSEYCYTIWQARNDVLFRYKVLGHDTVEKIAHILRCRCEVLYADSCRTHHDSI